MIRLFAVSIFALTLASSGARAEEINLLFATTGIGTANFNVRFFHPWAERINEQAKGLIHIDVRDGEAIANTVNVYERVQEDVVQIGWVLPAVVAGKYPRTNVTALPFEVDTAEHGSVALWRLYKSGALDAEYDTMHPLFLNNFPPNGIHLAKAPKTLANFNGLKIAPGSKVGGDVVASLGGAPISVLVNDYYSSLQRGMIDGVLVAWTAFQVFKLDEVTTYHIEAGLSGTAGMVFMTKERFDALPAAARKILDDNSGEAASRGYGAFWDTVDREGRDAVKALGSKHQIVTVPPEIAEKWRAAVAPITDNWVKATPDGAKVLATFRSEMADVKAGR